MDARTGTIEMSLEAPAAARPKWFRRPVTKGFAVAIFLGFAAVTVLQDIYLSWRQKYWLDSAHVPWSTGDIAVMQRGSTAEAAAIPALRGIPNVSVSYYDIAATDRAGIRSELDAKGIHIGGARYDALNTWNYYWKWDAMPGGGCGAANARLTFYAHLTLPRLTTLKSLTPELAQQWRSYMNALIRHEASHMRQAFAGRYLVARAVRTSGCATANEAGQRAINQLAREAWLYDARTNHGANDGAIWWRRAPHHSSAVSNRATPSTSSTSP